MRFFVFGVPNVPNIWHLAHLARLLRMLWGVSNAKTFGTYEQLCFKDDTVRIEMLYENINFLIIFSLLSIILSPFFTVSLTFPQPFSPPFLFLSQPLSQSTTVISPPTASPSLLTNNSPPPFSSTDAARQASCFASASAAPSNLPPSKSARSH